MSSINPIGVFDSGIGGLSVAAKIRELLPFENIVYIADSLYAPYGDRTEEFIYERSKTLVEFLIEQGAKAVVIACNTATVSTVQKLREEFDIPIIGVEPGIKPAVLNTRSGVVGVIATTKTINSSSCSQLTKQFSGEVRIELQACPGLMEQVETLSLESEKTEVLIKQYIDPLMQKGVDNIVLGCTHYAFLMPLIQKVTGPDVLITDTAMAVARQTVNRLNAENLLSTATQPAVEEFWTSGDQSMAQEQISLLWGQSVSVKHM